MRGRRFRKRKTSGFEFFRTGAALNLLDIKMRVPPGDTDNELFIWEFYFVNKLPEYKNISI